MTRSSSQSTPPSTPCAPADRVAATSATFRVGRWRSGRLPYVGLARCAPPFMLGPSPAWPACAWPARGVQPAAKAHPVHLSRAHKVMEFDRVVFNEEPGAVYGPGAMPTPCGARERVLARGGGRESTPSRMRVPAQPPPARGASHRRVEHARTRPTGARGATRPRTPHPHPQLARAHAAQCEPTLATT